MYLNEAFRALDALNEDTFSVSDDGIAKLADFQQNDDLEDQINVIDPEAETEEDLQDSYVGKIIVDCGVCHSKLYKDKEEIELNDDRTLANVGEECPLCYTSDGFKIIGEVAAFDGETTPENEILTDEEIDNEDEELTEAYEDTDGVMGGNKGQKYTDVDLKAYWEKEKDNDPILKNYNGNFNAWHKDTTSQMKRVNEGLFDKLRKNDDDETKSDKSDRYFVILVNNGGRYKYTKMEPNRSKVELERAIEGMPTATLPKGSKYEIVRYGDAKQLVGKEFINSWGKSWHESVEEGLFGIKTKKEKEKEAKAKAEREAKKKADKEEAKRIERERQADVARGWKEREDRERQAKAEYNRSRYNGIKGDKPSNTGYRGVNYSGGDYYEDLDTSKSIKESVNNVNVETDEDVINVTTDDTGKVTVTTEPKVEETSVGDEVIVPVSSETEDSIMTGSESEIDTEIEEFDEESFDELGESYLKEVYDNVTSYKTSDVKADDKTIVVEGIVTFDSGAAKKTSFILEAKDCTRSGVCRFTGSNQQLTEGKKAYVISGRVVDKKFIVESFNYNYKSLVEGVSTRIYGSVSR